MSPATRQRGETLRGEGRARRISHGSVALLLTVVVLAAAETFATREPAAEVDGQPVTAVGVETTLGTTPGKLQGQIYPPKRQKVMVPVAERLPAREASRRSVSIGALIQADVIRRLKRVSHQGVDTASQAEKAGPGATPDFPAEVGLDPDLFKWSAIAPAAIDRVEDLQCLFCRRNQPTLKQFPLRYGGSVTVARRDLPIDRLCPQRQQGQEVLRL